MKRKTVMYIAFAVLALAATAAIYVYKEYNRTHADTASLDPDFHIKADSLISEFEKAEDASNSKYWDKVIQVEGMVKEISGESGSYAIALGDTTSLSSVRCSIDSAHSDEVRVIKKGAHAIVKGICAGFRSDGLLGSDVLFVRCTVVSKNKF